MQETPAVTENSKLTKENPKTQFTAKTNKPHHQIIWQAFADLKKKRNNPDLSQTEFLVFVSELYGKQEALNGAAEISAENQRLISANNELQNQFSELNIAHEQIIRVREESVKANEQLTEENQQWKEKYTILSNGSKVLLENFEKLQKDFDELQTVALEFADDHPEAAEYQKTLEWMYRVIECTGAPYSKENSPMAVFHALTQQFRQSIEAQKNNLNQLKYFLFEV